MFFFGYLILIFLALLPFFFFFKGYQGDRKQHNKALKYHKSSVEEYQKNTICKHCGKRNFIINMYVTTAYEDETSDPYEPYYSETKTRKYTFLCRNCKTVIFSTDFNTNTTHKGSMPSYTLSPSESFGVAEADVLAELKTVAEQRKGCSYGFYYLAGIFFLVLDILMLILADWGVL